MNHTYFAKLNIDSTITEKVLEKVQNSTDDKWYSVLDQSLFRLELSDFEGDPRMCKIIDDLKLHDRLSVYRFNPDICFQWHVDRARQCAINMLLTGFDSFCAFGKPSTGNKFVDVHKLEHTPNQYYLMNVKKFHCVYNFSNMRYILSIGVGDTPYDQVLEYMKTNNLLDE